MAISRTIKLEPVATDKAMPTSGLVRCENDDGAQAKGREATNEDAVKQDACFQQHHLQQVLFLLLLLSQPDAIGRGGGSRAAGRAVGTGALARGGVEGAQFGGAALGDVGINGIAAVRIVAGHGFRV